MQVKIGFSRPISKLVPYSWLIRKIQKTSYSHVYVQFYSSKFDMDIIYQASGSQVNCISTERFKTIETITDEFTIDLSNDSVKNMIQFCLKALGAPYDVSAVVGIGIVMLANSLGKDINNPLDDGTKEYFCSKFIETLMANFTAIKIDKKPSLVLPVDIFNTLVQLSIPHMKYL